MNTLKQILTIFGVLSLLATSAAVFSSPAAFAAKTCGGVETSILECGEANNENIENSSIMQMLKIFIKILTAGVGVAGVLGVVIGAILYTTAGSDPGQIKRAVGIFRNVTIGLLLYGFMFAITNFLIPGGIFG